MTLAIRRHCCLEHRQVCAHIRQLSLEAVEPTTPCLFNFPKAVRQLWYSILHLQCNRQASGQMRLSVTQQALACQTSRARFGMSSLVDQRVAQIGLPLLLAYQSTYSAI